MPFRRSHQKSRYGCTTCKQRRVKCDEAGPPCGNCRARGTDCQYTTTKFDQQETHKEHVVAVTNSKWSTQNTLLSFPATRQLLELQLMHRWSTSTYESMSSAVARDFETWRKQVPEIGMRNDFLLHGIFAITAFDIANSFGPCSGSYVNAALEYQHLAIQSFQTALSNTTEENFEASLYFSIVLMVISLASAQFLSMDRHVNGMIQNTMVHFELARGVGAIMNKSKDDIKSHPLFCYLDPITKLSRKPIDPTLEWHLARLSQLNENRSAGKLNLSGEEQVQLIMREVSCKKAVFWLRECFATCTEPGYRDYCLGWPSLAGTDYIAAIRANDEIALVILMLWGILVDQLRWDYWWATNFGKSLIDEISDLMKGCDPIISGIVTWAQEQVRIGTDEDTS